MADLGPSSAVFSPCRTWRYSLSREFEPQLVGCLGAGELGGTVTFVGLNPSTADETTDDPTIRRCLGFARAWGFERLVMVNLFAFRATDPSVMFAAQAAGVNIVGPDNDDVIAEVFSRSSRIMAAWGAHAPLERVSGFALRFSAHPFWALGLTKERAPRHPLYMRGDVQPFHYDFVLEGGSRV